MDYFYRSSMASCGLKEYMIVECVGEETKMLLNSLQKEYEEKREGYESVLYAYIHILMTRLQRCYKFRRNQKGIAFDSDEGRMKLIYAYIEEHLKDVCLNSVSKELHLHPNYLCSLMKRLTGTTFTKVVQDIRLQKAAHMLTATNQSISTIAGSVGYENTNYFYKLFSRKYGMTPKSYRAS